LLDAAATEKMQSSINKCITEVSSNLLIRNLKGPTKGGKRSSRGKGEKMGLKKRSEDFSLLTASTVGMDPNAGGAQLLQSHDPRRDRRQNCDAEAAAATPPPEAAAAPEGMFATVSASTSASTTTDASWTTSGSTVHLRRQRHRHRQWSSQTGQRTTMLSCLMGQRRVRMCRHRRRIASSSYVQFIPHMIISSTLIAATLITTTSMETIAFKCQLFEFMFGLF
jgi:hypothetical protein